MRSGLFLQTFQALSEIHSLPSVQSIPGESRALAELSDGKISLQVQLEPSLSLCGDQDLGVVDHAVHDTGVSDMIVHNTFCY